MDKMNYTYIVQCSDGTLYTGWTTDVERRVRTHNSGKGAKYTRSRLPVTLVYYETPHLRPSGRLGERGLPGEPGQDAGRR